MTPLRLVESPPEPATAGTGSTTPVRLPPGRHGIPPNLVRAHQQQRLMDAAATALTEQGYGRIAVTRVIELAGISSATFYKHFEDMWICLGVAYETEAEHLCKEVEDACAAPAESRRKRARRGIGAALAFLASEPTVARLLSAEPPPQAERLVAARLALAERLGAMLRLARESDDIAAPPALERRLIGAALALVSTHVVTGEPQRLRELEPSLAEFLLSPL